MAGGSTNSDQAQNFYENTGDTIAITAGSEFTATQYQNGDPIRSYTGIIDNGSEVYGTHESRFYSGFDVGWALS